jgi:amino acid permease
VLVSVGQLHVHRTLGALALPLAIAMLPVATFTAIAAARRGVAPAGVDPITFLIVPLGALVVFAAMVTAGIANRRRPEWHKRFMLIATFAILTPAIARLAIVGQRPAIALGLTSLLVVLVAARDFRVRGQIHPATLWGGGILIASAPLRFIIGHTDAWHAFARSLVG